MKSQGRQFLEVGGRELLGRASVVEFVERIGRALHAAVEKVAGIGGASVVGHFRIAAVQRKIGGRGGGAALEQPRARTGKAEEVENIRLRTVRDTAHRVGEFVQRNANQQVWIDVGGEERGAIVRGGVVGADHA